MIEKMKYINIMGPVDDMNRVIETYISKYDIQLENALRELTNVKYLSSFSESNPYSNILKDAKSLIDFFNIDKNESVYKKISKDNSVNIINNISNFIKERKDKLEKLQNKKDMYNKVIEKYEPFLYIDFNIEDLKKFEFIKYRFGKMPLTSFKQFETFLYKAEDILFLKSRSDSEYIWGVYFTTDSSKEKVDSVFSSLHFEVIDINFEIEDEILSGSPNKICNYLKERINDVEVIINQLSEKTITDSEIDKLDILSAYMKIRDLYTAYESKKYAAKTEDNFYIFVGWMIEKDALKLKEEIDNDKDIVFIDEDENNSIISRPPIKLKNIKLFRPFELFVKMYGLPNYNEIDPTPFVALTYTILFGMMFGDLGQGLLLFLLGAFIYYKKGIKLGSVMSVIGMSSMFFGIMYGSIFGFEDIIPSLWLRPASSVNSILIFTVIFGIAIIFVSMIFNIVNSIKNKNTDKLFFDANGISGIIFYASVIFIAFISIVRKSSIGLWFIILFIAVPLILIVFKEPINKLLKHKKNIIKGSKAQFLLETLMEAVEVLLSYFTNTVSFVRVGGFAISHAGLMGAVMLLSGIETGSGNLFIIIIGNLIVMILEGLVVGIQVLRLEFYEMFSRFYTGNGREFVSYKNNIE